MSELNKAYCVAEYCTLVSDDKYAMKAAEAMPLLRLSADTTAINATILLVDNGFLPIYQR